MDHRHAHVHVFGDGEAKINLGRTDGAPELVRADNMSGGDVRAQNLRIQSSRGTPRDELAGCGRLEIIDSPTGDRMLKSALDEIATGEETKRGFGTVSWYERRFGTIWRAEGLPKIDCGLNRSAILAKVGPGPSPASIVLPPRRAPQSPGWCQ